jgi:pimeloyl-ACP methyl ester carboxylesterase
MLLRWYEHSQVYHPSREMDASPTELRRAFEDVYFKTSDGVELNGWFFPANENSPRANLVVLVCHGNAGNISTRIDFYRALLEAGVAVFAFDYRGYGRSRGKPSEEGTYLDAQAAHQWLARKGFSNVIAYGESLGGGIATELCLREQTCGLILQSTFTCIPDLGCELYPWLPVKLISTIKYDTCAKLPRIKVPVLVLHGRADRLIGFHHAEKLFATASEPKLFGELGGEHNNPLAERAGFIADIQKFLALVSDGIHAGSQLSPAENRAK